TTKFTIGLMSGALIGAGIALLFAPDNGKNTRDMLSYRLSKYSDDLKTIIHQLKKEKASMISDAKKKGDEVVESAKQRADNLIREAEDLLENIEKSK
ncbi:MAG: YtxH domain-containing protein, partial [Balneolaceae bacterium]